MASVWPARIRKPADFFHLFFSPHSRPLNEIVTRYYQIYPNQLGDTDGAIRAMLLSGDLGVRNLAVLRPLTQEMGLDDKQTEMINDLTICYFKMLLEQHRYETGAIAADRQLQRLLDTIDFLFCTKQ